MTDWIALQRQARIDYIESVRLQNRAKVRAPSPAPSTLMPSGPTVVRRVVIRASIVKRPVHRQFDSHWRENNWTYNGDMYTGYYQTRFGDYEGYIEEVYRGHLEFFLLNAPECLQLHPHRGCFWDRGRGKMFVHFAQTIGTPDAGILEIERVLTESHELAIRQGYQERY